MPLPEFTPKTIKPETTTVATPSRTSTVTEAGTQSATPGHAVSHAGARVRRLGGAEATHHNHATRDRRTPLRTRPTILDTPS
jgi:hypothetical protein